MNSKHCCNCSCFAHCTEIDIVYARVLVEHLHSDNVKEGDIVQPWNKEATESGIKEINQAISGMYL